ncbi:MAG: hypothetical protein AAF678_04290, partial [Pseudomonadota bacterium]
APERFNEGRAFLDAQHMQRTAHSQIMTPLAVPGAETEHRRIRNCVPKTVEDHSVTRLMAAA